ncbi:replication factor a 1 rfa1 [Holotrichia oblita]|uniref:Replication factor a 1 rfa1 n=2 Tax=Holotrichia oblita TaxID=644536 RepID=A0ACB9TXZ5_HOLOL|nr:replication factor a 1 rfa1 [Holotrichia oblita]KAI4471656.1 replication factor a 1 rfa1 [Holotrichia oblita]
MDTYKLSEGALRTIMQGGQVDCPIMQVLGSKKIATISSDKERYRILLSDGLFHISFAMFTTQINEKMESGELPMFSVIKIKQYITSVVNNAGRSDKRVLVILDLEVIASGDKVTKKIGEPEPLPEDDLSNTATKQAASKPNVSHEASCQPTTSKGHPNRVTLNQSLQDQLTHPISSLTPYQNKWIIKARVTNKSNIRTWSNSRGEGKLFSMDLVDKSGEIRATAFRDLVDKFYDYLEIDKVYYISKCQLKPANKQYSSLKNDYEMTLTNESIIQLCEDDVDSVPQTRYNFLTVDKIGQMEPGSFVDVIGVCKAVSDLQTFQARSTGRELKKKELTLVDHTDNAISVTLWGQEAENFDGTSNPIIAIKGAKVGEFGGGKNLGTTMNGILKVNPDIPEAHRLRGWYDNSGMHKEMKNLSARTGGNFDTPWMNFKEVREQNLGHSESGDYFQVCATILLLRSENLLYKACPVEECNKKVIDMENGMFRCEKCCRESPNFKYRLLGNVNVGDFSGNQWLTMFSSEVEKVLGMSAAEVGKAYDEDKSALAEIANKANFKQFVFRCRAKYEVYNDENRLKTVAVRVDPVNRKEYNVYLISEINQLMGN